MWLAMRAVRRSRARFGLLVGALSLLVVLVIGLQAMLDGLVVRFVGAIESQSGEVLVLGDDARRNVAGSVVGEDRLRQVAAVDGVDEVAPVVHGSISADPGTGGGTVDVAVFGYGLGGVGGPSAVAEGRLPEAAGEAAVSAGHAGDGLGLGDRVALGDGGPTVEVVGLVADADHLAQPSVFVAARDAMGAKRAANPDAVAVPPSYLAVRPAAGVDPDALVERLGAVPGVEALTRGEAADDAPGVAATGQSILLIVAVTLGATLVVVGFAFTILAVQRAPEHALVRALGAPARSAARTLAAELALAVGAAVGVAVGLLVLARASGADGGLLRLDAGAVAVNVVVLGIGAALAAVLPLRRVRRADPLAVAGTGAGTGLGAGR
jgi:putative ABC transport system permease protein